MSNYNLFMICPQPIETAFTPLPTGYHIRTCRKEEIAIWKAMPFDDQVTANKYEPFMQDYFNRVYASKEELFYERCLFLCDSDDKPIGTAFIWPISDNINTLHWFKILKGYENKGLGRALLSVLLSSLPKEDYPLYLHTQPESNRAIKLYSDFGFKFIIDKKIGSRINHLDASLPILYKNMPEPVFAQLKMVNAPASFLKALALSNQDEF